MFRFFICKFSILFPIKTKYYKRNDYKNLTESTLYNEGMK